MLLAAGCMTQRAAPVQDRRAAVAPPPQPVVVEPVLAPGPAATYTVKRGDTLHSIALELGIDYRDLARWNGLDGTARLRIGQPLRIAPTEEEAAVQIGTARGTGPLDARPLDSRPLDTPAAPPVSGDAAAMKTSPKALRLPYSEQNLALLAKGEPQVAIAKPAPVPVAIEPRPEPAKPGERDPDALDFMWPAKGRVLAGFSEPTSKGVDIGGRIGDPVVAAAQGRVMYTGTGIRGYGKLIVIKHDNGFNSVYAHNREILVKEGQTVARGQKIAELGDSDADAPKLHFEIRKSGKPVDPLRYLPPG
jgi:lipoprotein NlpD